jgi:nucleotide-binding universal stress UspA family protein
MFKRILVPLDGSSFGEAALGPAAALARKSGGELRLLNVHDQGWNPKRRVFAAEYRRWREEYLHAVGRGLFQVELSTAVREGRAEQQILEEAEAWAADVVVMSTHGRGGVTRLWLGSVADQCLRAATVPLLLVRARPSGESNGGALYSRRRIVVPLDGSELAERALRPAISLSDTLGAPLSIVRVVSHRQIGGLDSRDRMDLARASADARDYLKTVSSELTSQGLAVDTNILIDNNPAQAIIEHAGGDLVVMSTHSRPPLERAVLGSVTDKVVRGSQGPVVVIPGSCAREDATEVVVAATDMRAAFRSVLAS